MNIVASLVILLLAVRGAELCLSASGRRRPVHNSSLAEFEPSRCSDQRLGTAYCLNGGTCFQTTLDNSTLFSCICAEGYDGKRCEKKDLQGSYVLPLLRKSNSAASHKFLIALGVTAVLLGSVAAATALVFRYRRVRKKKNAAHDPV